MSEKEKIQAAINTLQEIIRPAGRIREMLDLYRKV